MSKNLTKNDLIVSLAAELRVSKSVANAALDHLVDKIVENLAVYGEVILTGFGAPITVRQKAKGGDGQVDEMSNQLENQIPGLPLKSQPGIEQRKLQRRNFILDIEVFDRSTQKTIGDLGDVTIEGMMLVSDEPVAENKSFELGIRLPEEAEVQLEIEFTALSIRCQKTIHENIYITGFKIESLDEKNRRQIEYFIDEYAV
jgi:nucleoid DNA-binding protein